MARTIIAPSILSADFARLGEEARAVEAAGADWLHVDVMDGHFVPNLTIGPVVVKALRPHVRIPIDVHLMIAPADPYLDAFVEAGADHLLVHPEAGPHLSRTLQHIRRLGAKAGVVFDPATAPDALSWLADEIDIVLVMTVNPGFGAQSFMPSQLAKMRACREMIDASGREIVLEVDGGVNPETAQRCREAGATALVAGTAVFGAPGGDYAAAIAALRG
ncbi:MAG TPA: ribulose-phosphate 3-epimerase [Caulobacteraceae bacterium]|nr:ribulose-phosphate 3-epimerase [Caulobacteraceae bacterium]